MKHKMNCVKKRNTKSIVLKNETVIAFVLKMHPSVRVCGVSVRAPVKGLRGKCSRRNYRLVACATPYTSTELRKMRKEVLVKELTKHDLDTKGTKAQLIERIQTHVTNKVPSLRSC